LAPFQWQLTHQTSIQDIQGWLASDKFPSPQGSRQVLQALANDRIGTDDRNIIEEYIDSSARPSLTIKIGWPDGDGPGESISIRKTIQSPQVQMLYNSN
jgi:hypothetical protein